MSSSLSSLESLFFKLTLFLYFFDVFGALGTLGAFFLVVVLPVPVPLCFSILLLVVTLLFTLEIDGDVNEGDVNEGDVNEGDVNEGDVNEGDVNEGNDNGNGIGKDIFDFLIILESSILFALSLSLSQAEYDFLILFFALLFSFDKIIEPSDKKLSHSSSIHAMIVYMRISIVMYVMVFLFKLVYFNYIYVINKHKDNSIL
jgi:hypothetical protein